MDNNNEIEFYDCLENQDNELYLSFDDTLDGAEEHFHEGNIAFWSTDVTITLS